MFPQRRQRMGIGSTNNVLVWESYGKVMGKPWVNPQQWLAPTCIWPLVLQVQTFGFVPLGPTHLVSLWESYGNPKQELLGERRANPRKWKQDPLSPWSTCFATSQMKWWHFWNQDSLFCNKLNEIITFMGSEPSVLQQVKRNNIILCLQTICFATSQMK